MPPTLCRYTALGSNCAWNRTCGYIRDEPVALARYGFDKGWMLRIIIQDLAKKTGSESQIAFLDKTVFPYPGDQFILLYHLSVVLDEDPEKLKCLRCDRNIFSILQ